MLNDFLQIIISHGKEEEGTQKYQHGDCQLDLKLAHEIYYSDQN